MNRTLLAVILCQTVLSYLVASPCAIAKRVRNLSEASAAIKSPEGKKYWQTEMMGDINYRLGERLPAGISEDDLSRAVFAKSYAELRKEVKTEDLQALTAIKFPGRPGLYIGVGAIQKMLNVPHEDLSDIAYNSAVEMIVFKIPSPHHIEVIARTTSPFLFADGYRVEEQKTDRTADESQMVSIDHATFCIAPDTYAFGLRLSSQVGYAGGGESWNYLHLFVVDGQAIRPIYGGEIYHIANLAGDWHPDQTRDHYITENKAVLIVLPQKHEGYFDLLQRTRGRSCKYVWSSTSREYKAQGVPLRFKA